MAKPVLVKKPLLQLCSELAHSLAAMSECVSAVEADRYFMLGPLYGQLRLLLTEKRRDTEPLLFHVAELLKEELKIYCVPPLVQAPCYSRENTLLLIEPSGPEISSGRQLAAQKEYDLQSFLDEELINFTGKILSIRDLIKVSAEKLGGAHNPGHMPDYLARLMRIQIGNYPAFVPTLLRFAKTVIDLGRRLLRRHFEGSIWIHVVIPPQEIGGRGYIFDRRLGRTRTKMSAFLESDFRLHFTVQGESGYEATVVSNRPVATNTPLLLGCTVNLTDSLATNLHVWVNDHCTAATTVHPVLAPFAYRQYESVLAKAVNTKSHGLEMYSITLHEGPGVLDDLATKRNQAVHASILRGQELRRPYFSQQAFAHSAAGESDYKLTDVEWRDLKEIDSIVFDQ